MPDATVIPMDDGDRAARLAASRAAREVGATGRRRTTPRPTAKQARDAYTEEDGYAEPDEPVHAVPEPEADPEIPSRVADWLDFLRRRITGDYDVDDFGFDRELTDRVLMAPLRPLYSQWFRVETRGMENIPSEGGALLVGNHSGTVALDALMTQLAVHDHHPAHRDMRMLGANLVFSTPFVGELARKAGHTLACTPDAERWRQHCALERRSFPVPSSGQRRSIR